MPNLDSRPRKPWPSQQWELWRPSWKLAAFLTFILIIDIMVVVLASGDRLQSAPIIIGLVLLISSVTATLIRSGAFYAVTGFLFMSMIIYSATGSPQPVGLEFSWGLIVLWVFGSLGLLLIALRARKLNRDPASK